MRVNPGIIKKGFFLFLVALLLISGLIVTRDYVATRKDIKQLKNIESFLIFNPDSALAEYRLLQLDTANSEQVKGYSALVYNEILNKKKLPLDSGKLQQAYDYFKDSNTSREYAVAIYLSSYFDYYYSRKEYNINEVVDKILKAHDIAQKKKDFHLMAKCDEMLADIYNSHYGTPSALKYYRRAAEEFKKSGNIRNHHFMLCDYAYALSSSSKPEESLKVLTRVYDRSKKDSDSLLTAYCLRDLMSTYFEMGNYDNVIIKFNEFLQYSSFIPPICQDYVVLSRSLTQKGRYDEALAAAQNAMASSIESQDLGLSNVAFYELYSAQNNYKQAFIYGDKIIELTNSETSKALDESVASAEIASLSESISIKDKLLRLNTIRVVFISCFFIIIIIMVVYIMSHHFHKKKLAKEERYFDSIRLLDKNMHDLRGNLESLLTSEKEEVNRLNGVIETKDSSLTELKSAAEERDGYIHHLENKLSEHEVAATAYDNYIEVYASTMQNLILSCEKYFSNELAIQQHEKDTVKERNPKAYAHQLKELKNNRLKIFNSYDEVLKQLSSEEFLKQLKELLDIRFPGKIDELEQYVTSLNFDERQIAYLILGGFSMPVIINITKAKKFTAHSRKRRLKEKIMESELPSKEFWITKVL